MNSRQIFVRLTLLFSPLAVALQPALGDGEKPAPPAQPDSGPGGKDYRHASVTKKVYGKGGQEYWLFEPAEPKPESAPLIVFNHGWTAINPWVYSAWIEHIVRRGNIVVYPRYQENALTPPRDFAPNAVQAVKSAIERLQTENGHVRPELERFAIVGHSAGGLLSANMAARAKEDGLPEPKAVMCVQPGKTTIGERGFGFPMDDLSKIPAGTLLLTVAGDADLICGDADARKIYREATQIPAVNKNMVLVVSDNHGSPPLLANHMAPLAFHEQEKAVDEQQQAEPPAQGDWENRLFQFLQSELGKQLRRSLRGVPILGDLTDTVNAQDYYGYWRLFDALCDAAFYGKNREQALGNTPQQRFMGKWSDGTPIKELKVIEDP